MGQTTESKNFDKDTHARQAPRKMSSKDKHHPKVAMESLAKINSQVKEVRIYDKKTIEQEKINETLQKSPSYGNKIQSNMAATKSSVDVRSSKFIKEKTLATLESQEAGQVKTKKQLEINNANTSSQVMATSNAKNVKTNTAVKSLKSVNSVQALQPRAHSPGLRSSKKDHPTSLEPAKNKAKVSTAAPGPTIKDPS